jgi:hypothetical protein
MTLCDSVIVEERTRKLSLIGTFWSLAVDDGFPTGPVPITVVVRLVGGLGDIPLTLTVGLESGLELDDVHEISGTVTFRDRFRPTNFVARLRSLEFQVPGHYHFFLRAGDAELAHTTLRVYDRRSTT